MLVVEAAARPQLRWAPAALALVAAWTSTALQKGDPVPYPRDHRDFHHVESMVIQPGHALHDAFGGIHHVYANPLARRGLADGRFQDGSVLVFDLLAAYAGGNTVQEGPRTVLGVMHKSDAAFPDTGGYGFAGFTDSGDVVKDMQQQCFLCHLSQQAHGYAFSRPRPGRDFPGRLSIRARAVRPMAGPPRWWPRTPGEP